MICAKKKSINEHRDWCGYDQLNKLVLLGKHSLVHQQCFVGEHRVQDQAQRVGYQCECQLCVQSNPIHVTEFDRMLH